MTEEQIKRNAEEYIKEVSDNKLERTGGYCATVYSADEIEEAYITGAHSRDEEIRDVANDCRARLNNYENQLCEARDDVKKWREEYENQKRDSKFWHDLYCSNYDEMHSYMGFIRGFFWDVKVSGFRTALKVLFQKKED